MQSIYQAFKSNLLKTFRNATWLSENSARKSLLNLVQRRLLHWYATRHNQRDALNAVSLPDYAQVEFFQSIKRTSEPLSAGTVVVQGSLENMTTCDWLTVEHELIKAQLQHGDRHAVPLSALKSDSAGKRVLPSLFYHNLPFSRDYAEIFAALAVWSITTIIPVMIVGAIISKAAIMMMGYIVLTQLGIGVLSLILSLALSSYADSVQRERMLSEMAKGLSSDWDDVLNMKTFEDALLMAWLAECMRALQNSPTPQLIPDFLAHSPTDVLDFLASVLTRNGVISDTDVKRIQLCILSSIEKSCDRESQLRNSIAGVDFSNLREVPSDSTTTNAQMNAQAQPLFADNLAKQTV